MRLQSGMWLVIDKWDLIIAHPPCTYLSNVNTRGHSIKATPVNRIIGNTLNRIQGMDFFMRCVTANCDKIVVENPIGIMNSAYRKPDQIIQPYYFAESEDDIENYQQKTTCLWLKGVAPLERTNNLPKPEPVYVRELADGTKKAVYFEENHGKIGNEKHKNNDSAARSKTFAGVAKAMAEQWG